MKKFITPFLLLGVLGIIIGIFAMKSKGNRSDTKDDSSYMDAYL